MGWRKAAGSGCGGAPSSQRPSTRRAHAHLLLGTSGPGAFSAHSQRQQQRGRAWDRSDDLRRKGATKMLYSGTFLLLPLSWSKGAKAGHKRPPHGGRGRGARGDARGNNRATAFGPVRDAQCVRSHASHFTDFIHTRRPYIQTVKMKDGASRNTRPPDSRPFPLNHHSSFTVPVTGGPLVQRHRQDPACGLAYLSRPALAPEEITW